MGGPSLAHLQFPPPSPTLTLSKRESRAFRDSRARRHTDEGESHANWN